MTLLGFFEKILGIGLEPKNLNYLHVALRGIIVFIVALVILRVGNKRFLSKMSAFDAILGFILASMLARAVNGSASFLPTLFGGFVLIGIHWLLAVISVRFPWFERLVKGNAENLINAGRVDRETMRRHQISESDIIEEARLNAQVSKLGEIKNATLERSGEISVVPADPAENKSS